MINIPIKLRPSELQPFANMVNDLFKLHSNDMNHVDFFNLRHITKQLLDKHFRVQPGRNKEITINVNCNVCESILKLHECDTMFYKIETISYPLSLKRMYEKALLLAVVGQIDKHFLSKKTIADMVKNGIFENG